LPDLSERIQVGLLNVLESATCRSGVTWYDLNLTCWSWRQRIPRTTPNRGRLITPLKDRFGSQIRTHYPFEVTTEIAIMHQEAKLPTAPVPIKVPWFIDDIVARVSHVARRSHVISQSSGVSVRLSIANYETVVANALRRTLRTHDNMVVPRVSDLSAMVQSTQGKIEFDTMDDADTDQVIAALVSLAVRQCFSEHVLLEEAPEIVEAFNAEVVVHTGDDLPDGDYLVVLGAMPALEEPVERVAGPEPVAERRPRPWSSFSRVSISPSVSPKTPRGPGRSIARGIGSARSLRVPPLWRGRRLRRSRRRGDVGPVGR